MTLFYTFRNLVSERTPGFFYLLRHSDDFSIACHLWPLENSTVLLREHENQKDKPRLSMAGKIVLTQEHLKGSLRFPGSPDFTLGIAALRPELSWAGRRVPTSVCVVSWNWDSLSVYVAALCPACSLPQVRMVRLGEVAGSWCRSPSGWKWVQVTRKLLNFPSAVTPGLCGREGVWPSLVSCPERCLPDKQHLSSGF